LGGGALDAKAQLGKISCEVVTGFKCFRFWGAKNHKIANKSATVEAREKIKNT
jgi:hypothetical protein